MAKSARHYAATGVDLELGDSASEIMYNACRATWGNHCSVVQPVITGEAAQVLPTAIIYENLSIRAFMALFSAAGCFCGTTSVGTHVTAAFGVPSVVVLWRELFDELRSPTGKLCMKAMFLYPQRHFVVADDLYASSGRYAALDVVARQVSHREARPANAMQDFPGLYFWLGPRRQLVKAKTGRMTSVPAISRP